MKHRAIKAARGLAIAAGTSALLAGGANAAVVDLSTWTAESYPAVAGFGAGVWTVSGDFLSVNQSVNGQPTLFVSDFDAAGLAIEGTVTVNTTGDDDLIGFALGFVTGDTSNNSADYLLIDWKQTTQPFNFGPPSCTAGSTSLAGLAVSRVTGVPTADEFWGHFDQAIFCSPAGEGVTELQRATNLGATGWADNTSYVFTFAFTTTSLKVFVDGVEELNIAGAFNDGRLAFYNFSQSNVTYSAFEIVPLGLTKILTSGPDDDDDGEVDIAIEVGQFETTAYDFTMIYSNPGGPDVLIVDTAPAEWIVTDVGGQSVDVDECGESETVSNGFGSADVFKNGKIGKKCRSSTKILWTPPDPDGGVIRVDMTTRQSPGKKNVKFAPTSCGPLFLNSGPAKVFEVDEFGEPLRDPATGELLPPLFTAEPLVLAAVEDLDGGGIVPDGSGNEDGDALTDIEDVLHGFDPCSVGTGTLYAGTDEEEFEGELVDRLAVTPVVGGVPGGTGIVFIDTTLANRDFVNGLAPTGTGTLFSGDPFSANHNEIDVTGLTLNSVLGPLPVGFCCNEDLAFDGTHVWRAHFNAGPGPAGTLFKYLPDGTFVDSFAQTDVVGATFVWPADELWITKWSTRQVGTFDPDTNTFTSVFGTTTNAGGLAYDIERGILWVGERFGNVSAYDLTAGAAPIPGSAHQPFGIFGDTVDGLAFVPD